MEPGYYIVKTKSTRREYEICYYAGHGYWFLPREEKPLHGEDMVGVMWNKINVKLAEDSYGQDSFMAGWEARDKYETAKSQVMRRLTEHEMDIYRYENKKEEK